MAIYKDKKRGTYYISVYVEKRNGEKKRVVRRGFHTKAEAKKKESEIVFNAHLEIQDNPFFDDILEDYIAWYGKTRKASSLKRIKSAIKNQIQPFFKNKRIQQITKRDIMKFHNQMLETLSPVTVNHTHRYLSSIFKYAIQMEYINENVPKEVGNIKAKPKTFDYWTLEEFKQFISVVHDLKYKALFMLLFYSGMRIGEILAITWNDVDFKTRLINIDKTSYEGKISPAKTDKSFRKIKIPQHTLNLLKRLKLENKAKHDYFVFGNVYHPLSRTSVVYRYNKYVEESNVKYIRLHDFRASHASYLINNGYDIQIVSKRLGHAKVSITFDIYSHLYPNKEDEAVEQMEDDFGDSKVYQFEDFQ